MSGWQKTISVGDMVWLSDESYKKAMHASQKRHNVDASNTRGAGTNLDYHTKGCIGEQAILQKLDLLRGPEALNRASISADIIETTPQIEVKAGVPCVWKKALKKDCLYIVCDVWNNKRLVNITAMAFGHQIVARAEEPKYLPRHGTNKENWLIPNCISKIEVIVDEAETVL